MRQSEVPRPGHRRGGRATPDSPRFTLAQARSRFRCRSSRWRCHRDDETNSP